MANFFSLIAGLIFGFGLALSGMTHPDNILNFLDIADRWDPGLLFVMCGAVVVTMVGFRYLRRAKSPLFADKFYVPRLQHIDRSLVIGSAMFGIGWGISGYCPGPAISLLAAPNWEAGIFLPAMLVGMVSRRLFKQLNNNSIKEE